MSINVHPSAIVAPGAKLAEGVSIGAYSVIGENVCIDEGTIVAPHVVIDGHTTIGKYNQIFQFASVGSNPQDLKYRGEASELRIGDSNTIREYVTLQPGTEAGSMISKVGSNNLFMVGSHVGHDALVGDNNVFANYCCLAGHVTIESRVTIGGLSGIHQFVRIGQLSILGAGAMVAQDIPPFCIAQGDHAKLIGINKVGILRAGYSAQDTSKLRKLFRNLFWNKSFEKDAELLEKLGSQEKVSRGLSQKLRDLEAEFAGFEAGKIMFEFLKTETKRGLAAANRTSYTRSEESDS